MIKSKCKKRSSKKKTSWIAATGCWHCCCRVFIFFFVASIFDHYSSSLTECVQEDVYISGGWVKWDIRVIEKFGVCCCLAVRRLQWRASIRSILKNLINLISRLHIMRDGWESLLIFPILSWSRWCVCIAAGLVLILHLSIKNILKFAEKKNCSSRSAGSKSSWKKSASRESARRVL